MRFAPERREVWSACGPVVARNRSGTGRFVDRGACRGYLVAPAGNPTYGDDFLLRAWLTHLAVHRPDADVVVDCHTPARPPSCCGGGTPANDEAVALAAGASGLALCGRSDYYPVKHRSLLDAGSAWKTTDSSTCPRIRRGRAA